MTSRRIAAVPVMLAAFVLAGLEANFAHDDEDHDKEVSDTISTSETFKAERDSIFALINKRYEKVEHILKKDCYNCHSLDTDFPWYHAIPGVKGFMDGHIAEAMEHVDFSYGFPFRGHGDPLSTLIEIKDEIEEGDMPILSYRIMHWGSLIEGKEQDTLFYWIDESIGMIRDFYKRSGVPLSADKDNETDNEDSDTGGDEDH